MIGFDDCVTMVAYIVMFAIKRPLLLLLLGHLLFYVLII